MNKNSSKAALPPFAAQVESALDHYFGLLDGASPEALHTLVMTTTERAVITYALRLCEGKIGEAAVLLGISRNTLSRKILELNICNAAYKPALASKPVIKPT